MKRAESPSRTTSIPDFPGYRQDLGLDTLALAREELSIDPEELGGSAWEAAVTSFVLFALGAIVPAIPSVFLAGAGAVVLSVVSSAQCLFAIGALITLLTGRSVLFSGRGSSWWGSPPRSPTGSAAL